ncbi:MAG: chromosome segregation SMC family protein [Patescibacteria group bacterium]
MYLQKLTIQGFKSFANKTSLEFTPGVTSIVGPNGSGKSNIADSVRWVLGEQSLKTLRGKKSEDVIFAGSDKKTRLGFCQVDLHLNNEDHKAPIDFNEIVISRKVYRDGNGEYFINKTKVRLQDILMLLAKSNFGQRSYSIISQGTVDLFLAATPAQRKEYFDEAAGVRQFQIKKEQAQNKLNQTRENLRQAELLIQEIEPRLRSLTRQVHRLERREEVAGELKKIQHEYYGGIWYDFKQKFDIANEKRTATENKKQAADDELKKLQQEMQQLALGSSRQDEFNKLQREYDRIVAEKNGLLRDQAVLRGRKQTEHEQRGEFDLSWLEQKRDQLHADLKETQGLLKQNEQDMERYDAAFKQKEAELGTLTKENADLAVQLEREKAKLRNKKTIALPEISENVARIYARQKKLLEKIDAVQNPEELRGLKADARTVTTELAQLNHTLSNAGAGNPVAIISLQEKITLLLSSKGTLLTAISELSIKAQVARERVMHSETKITELDGELKKISGDLQRLGSRTAVLGSGLVKEEEGLNRKLKETEKNLSDINGQLSKFNEAEQKKKEGVFRLQHTYSQKQEQLNAINAELNGLNVEIAKIETKQEDTEREMVDELSDEERQKIYELTKPPAPRPELFSDIQKLKHQLELIGGIDPQVSHEYSETKERYDFLTKQSEDLIKAMSDLEEAIANLDETIKKQFSKSFEQIGKHFAEYFKILFNGGNASLSLVKEEVKLPDDDAEDGDEDVDDDAEDGDEDRQPREEEEKSRPALKAEKVVTGIEVYATPPGKRLKGISMLSGGERALTSIALICAIIQNNPSPFVILDEVDAALDESNSIRFASIIDRLSKRSQFIVITHNRATMEQSHTLYGVTMGDDGVSKLLSINMQEAEKVIKNG